MKLLDMIHVLTACMLLWSSGLQAEENDPPEPRNMRLTGGTTRCAGELEMKLRNKWKPVDDLSFDWNLRTAAAVCRQLDCGSVVSAKIKHRNSARRVWKINASSIQSEAAPTESVSMKFRYSSTSLEITCSESVRLVNGTRLCSGRLEVVTDQSWSSICGEDFYWQDAEVVCRELGCGAPLKLQGAHNEGINISARTDKSQCKGNESTLLECGSYESPGGTCSPVHLTCSEPNNVRLVKGGSRCAGRLEMKLQDDWKPVNGLKSAALVCTQLKCGSAVSIESKTSVANYVWGILSSGSALREHVSLRPWHSSSSLEIICSDLLFQPVISMSPASNSVHEASGFTINCSITPQYPGGSFQLMLTTSNTAHIYTQEAVNHEAQFPFPAAHGRHQGNYSCIYHISVFSHSFSSESQTLFLRVSASSTVFFSRLAVLLLTFAFFISAICYYRRSPGGRYEETTDNDYYNIGVSRGQRAR